MNELTHAAAMTEAVKSIRWRSRHCEPFVRGMITSEVLRAIIDDAPDWGRLTNEFALRLSLASRKVENPPGREDAA